MIQLGEQPGRGGHQPSTIERDDRLLSALGFDFHHDRAVAPCGRLPADAPDVFPRLVVAQPCERRGGARRARPPEPHHDPHAATQHQLVATDREHVGIDGRRLVGLDSYLPDEPATRPPAAEVDRSEPVRTAMRRLHRVLDAEQAFAVKGAGQDPVIGLQLRGYVVGQFRRKSGRVGVGDQHLNRLDLAQRKWLRQHPAGYEARRFRQPAGVGEGESQQHGVIAKEDDQENRMRHDQQDQDRA